MLIGIDLSTVNCGLCFMSSPEEYSLATIGMKDLDNETIESFCKAYEKLVANQVCFVDFNYNECFLRGKKKHIAVKYYLAGYTLAVAKEAHFIAPNVLRKHFGYTPKTSKIVLHEELLDGKLFKADEHQRDAYLLALMGMQLKGNN